MQAATKKFSYKARRLLLIFFGMMLCVLIISALYISFNYQRLTLSLANHFLQPYQIELKQLSVKPLSLTHLLVPQVSLTVNDSDVKITELEITLLPEAKLLDLGIDDLQSLSAKNVDVQLSPNILRQSTANSDTSNPTIALDFAALPEIEIDQTRFTLKGIAAERLTMSLANLTLDKSGRFNSQIAHNNASVFSLDAQLSSNLWQAKTQINFDELQALTANIYTAESQLFPINSDIVTENDKHTSSLLGPLYQLQEMLHSQQINLSGRLDSTMSLALKSGQLQSTHQLNQFSVELKSLADLTLAPSTLPIRASLVNNQPKPLNLQATNSDSTQSLVFALNGHIADLQLTVQPFELVAAPSKQQLTDILHRLNDAPFEKALSNLYNVMSIEDKQANVIAPQLRIAVNTPINYKLQDKSISTKLMSINLLQSKLAVNVDISEFSYSVSPQNIQQKNDFKVAFNWQVQANHQQNILLNSLWPTLTTLPYDIAIDNAAIELQGIFTAAVTDGKPSYSVNIAPQALQLTQGVTLSNNAYNINAVMPRVNASIKKTELELVTAAEYHLEQGKTTLIIPEIRYKLEDGLLTQQYSDSQKTHYQLEVASALVALQNPTTLTMSSSKSPTFTTQLLHQTLSNGLNWSLVQVELDKSTVVLSGKKKRKIDKKLLHLEQVNLTQAIQLKSAELYTQEDWWINDINLSSQHSYSPRHSQFNRFNLKGDWQFNSEFEPIIAFLSQTESLPESIILNGNTALDVQYQLKRDNDTQFLLTFEPNVTNIEGSFANLPFEGGAINTQCHYQWQQTRNKNSSSNFKCDNIELVLQAFNPGVLITDIAAEATLSFSTDSSLSSPHITTDEANNLALPAEIFGVKQASVRLTAKGDLLDGQLLIPQFKLSLKKPSSAYFVLQHINLEKLLEIQPQVGIYADGIFDGVLPITIENGKAEVKGGQLAARSPGGVIAVSGNPAVDQMRLSQPYLEFAFSALEHLEYSQLSSSFDMDTLGDAILKVNVKGRSKGIERPIHLNYSQEENMLQLLRSLQIGDNLQNQIENSIQQ
ncbi:intermembrane phospholipid transport protein YdbH family protein [Shewanella kaireitica]|uniref:intermembrane phospholipid transport protein YdbH family protein n=1 Tax=Shewanella kaireitica TaxID=212021 RepID=UPI00200D0998|nr:YdbH domain-containing protein [Shewanella kaireitica]